MKSRIIQLLVLAVFTTLVVCTSFGVGPPPLGVTTRCQIVRVVDGDTADVRVTIPLRVRLKNCWAAELPTATGKAAAQALAKRALSREAILEIPTGQASNVMEVFTFGRVVGTLWLANEDQSLNEWMIENGHATAEKAK